MNKEFDNDRNEENGFDSETIPILPQPKIQEQIPKLEIGTEVIILVKDHPLFMEQGKIEAKDHNHYHIKFISLNEKINNTRLWVPEHWVGKYEKET